MLTFQADAKSAPVNPMKELRIEKLVISAYSCRGPGANFQLTLYRHLRRRVG